MTGHWIEEAQPEEWVEQEALFGFTQMNTAHNGVRLGQALYKVCARLGIVHKVLSMFTNVHEISFTYICRLAISHVIMHQTTTQCWMNLDVVLALRQEWV